jgi:hypothetical protein
MFSPATTQAVLNRCCQRSGQTDIYSSFSERRSPWLDQASTSAQGSTKSHPVLSVDTTALVTGSGATSNLPYCASSPCLDQAAASAQGSTAPCSPERWNCQTREPRQTEWLGLGERHQDHPHSPRKTPDPAPRRSLFGRSTVLDRSCGTLPLRQVQAREDSA